MLRVHLKHQELLEIMVSNLVLFSNILSYHLTPFKAAFFKLHLEFVLQNFFKKQKSFVLSKHIASTCQSHLSVLEHVLGNELF